MCRRGSAAARQGTTAEAHGPANAKTTHPTEARPKGRSRRNATTEPALFSLPKALAPTGNAARKHSAAAPAVNGFDVRGVVVSGDFVCLVTNGAAVRRLRRSPYGTEHYYLIQGQNIVKMTDPMDNRTIYYRSRMKIYPDGRREIMYALRPTFTPGNPDAEQKPKQKRKKDERSGFRHSDAAKDESNEVSETADASNFDRSRRRARAKVRDIALANQFRWFVTLTLDASKVDRYDIAESVKHLRTWLDNRVRRCGLAYVLVPERHKDGAIHFHGLFTDAVKTVDSGHKDTSGHTVYNLPEWTLGFSTAIELYGNYAQAVSYVCKYIGKQGEKCGGRWYFSGGKLEKPQIVYGILEDWEEAQNFAAGLQADPLAAAIYSFEIPETGNKIGIIRQNM